ncbi:unnamed protein product [Prorocentrum cordatum]|uniref:Uncharacterized protein n=1 Tax=Prorocentrum cordatum TaxID=2364126 RepID=A0ABN9VIX6_9DINO|nr:unnamed protein product [Polarella glacialis]
MPSIRRLLFLLLACIVIVAQLSLSGIARRSGPAALLDDDGGSVGGPGLQTSAGLTSSGAGASDVRLASDAPPGGGRTLQVVFVKYYQTGSSRMRVDDTNVMLRMQADSSINSTGILCDEYRKVYCGGVLRADLVVHVKIECRCDAGHLGIGMRHVYEPVDGLIKFGGLEAFLSGKAGPNKHLTMGACIDGRADGRCFSAYIVASKEMKRRADAVLGTSPSKAFVIPHHHSNFHDRVRDAGLPPSTVALAGKYKNNALVKNLSSFLRQQGLRDITVRYLREIKCKDGAALPPSETGDCFAQALKTVSVGIAWWQPGDPDKTGDPGIERVALVENSAQRLLNFLAVGVPAVAFAGYEAMQDALEGAHHLGAAADEPSLQLRVLGLLRDPAAMDEARREALEIARRFAPGAVGGIYRAALPEMARLGRLAG